MTNQVKSKVFQVPQDLCSIAGEATVVKTKYVRTSDFGVKCGDFERLNDRTFCALCGKEALFIPCRATLILEDLVNKIVMCKHFCIHSCP